MIPPHHVPCFLQLLAVSVAKSPPAPKWAARRQFFPAEPTSKCPRGRGHAFCQHAREYRRARCNRRGRKKSNRRRCATRGPRRTGGFPTRKPRTAPRSQTPARHPLAGIRRAQPARKPHLRRPPKARNVWLATRREELGSRRLPNISLEKFPGTALTGFVLWKFAQSLFWPSKSERGKNSPKKNSIQTAWGCRDLRFFLEELRLAGCCVSEKARSTLVRALVAPADSVFVAVNGEAPGQLPGGWRLGGPAARGSRAWRGPGLAASSRQLAGEAVGARAACGSCPRRSPGLGLRRAATQHALGGDTMLFRGHLLTLTEVCAPGSADEDESGRGLRFRARREPQTEPEPWPRSSLSAATSKPVRSLPLKGPIRSAGWAAARPPSPPTVWPRSRPAAQPHGRPDRWAASAACPAAARGCLMPRRSAARQPSRPRPPLRPPGPSAATAARPTGRPAGRPPAHLAAKPPSRAAPARGARFPAAGRRSRAPRVGHRLCCHCKPGSEGRYEAAQTSGPRRAQGRAHPGLCKSEASVACGGHAESACWAG